MSLLEPAVEPAPGPPETIFCRLGIRQRYSHQNAPQGFLAIFQNAGPIRLFVDGTKQIYGGTRFWIPGDLVCVGEAIAEGYRKTPALVRAGVSDLGPFGLTLPLLSLAEFLPSLTLNFGSVPKLG